MTPTYCELFTECIHCPVPFCPYQGGEEDEEGGEEDGGCEVDQDRDGHL